MLRAHRDQEYVGLSGYAYKPWQGEGRFYPPDLKQTQFFDYYFDRYRAVEMDGSWYRMPAEKSVATHVRKAPEGFKFSFKMHQRVTHLSRLKPECIESLEFLMKSLLPLAKVGKLGPFLLQLPPNMKRNDERLGSFLQLLPKTFARVEPGCEVPVQWAFEFRNDTWHADEVETLLRDAGAAWVASERDGHDAQRRDTADFVYARLRRSEYTDAVLASWAEYFDAVMKQGRPAYVYCKHEDEGSPWIWADGLLDKLGELSE